MVFSFAPVFQWCCLIYKCLNKLFLMRPHLCLIIGFFCGLSVVCNDSWMTKKTSTRPKQMNCFTPMEAEGEGRDPVKLT